MKALLYTAPYTFEYTTVPDPEIGPDDLLVRVEACGICGSDVKGFTGKTGRRLPPLIMGHEAAGVVEAVGENAEGFQPGDRVCFDSTVYCNACGPCRRGAFNYCENRRVLGVSLPDWKQNGAFAEYVAVPWWITAPIRDDMPFTHAALLEPVSIGVHAVNRGDVEEGDTALIIGAGPIGLFTMQAARLAGATRLIVSDPDERRLRLATTLGADVVVNPQAEDLKAVVHGVTEGRGADVAFEAVGYEPTVLQAIAAVRTGGRVVLIGNVGQQVNLDLQDFIQREVTLRGTYASSGEYRESIELVASGKIRVEPLISEIRPLSSGAEAFDRLHRGEEDLLKIVLDPKS